MSECEHTDKERQIAEIDSCPICLSARLAEAERLLAAVYTGPAVNACCEHVECGKSWFESRDSFLGATPDSAEPRETASRG